MDGEWVSEIGTFCFWLPKIWKSKKKDVSLRKCRRLYILQKESKIALKSGALWKWLCVSFLLLAVGMTFNAWCLLSFYFSLLPLEQINLTNLGRRILKKLKQDHYVKGQVTRLDFILTETGFWIRQFFVFSSAVIVPETAAICVEF